MFSKGLPLLIDDDHSVHDLGDRKFSIRRGDEEIAEIEVQNYVVTGVARTPMVVLEGDAKRTLLKPSLQIGPVRLEKGLTFLVGDKTFSLLPPISLGLMVEGFVALTFMWASLVVILVGVLLVGFSTYRHVYQDTTIAVQKVKASHDS